MPNATVFVDKKFEVVHASDKWMNSFGLEKDQVFGMSILGLFKDGHSDWRKALKNCLLGSHNEIVKVQHYEHEKVEKWYELINTPWYDDHENIIGIIIQGSDITLQVQEELRREKLESLLKEKSEIAKIGSWEYDAITNEATWCNMTKAIHEVPVSFIPNIESGIEFYKHGYSRNTLSMHVDNALRKGTPWEEKLQIVTAKGAEKWIISAGKPVYKNNKIVGLIGTCQDIDEEVQSIIKTKENEHLLKSLIDNLPLNIYIKDKDSRKILANKAECDFLGVKDQDELIGLSDFDLYDSEVARISRDEDISVMKSLKPILGRETLNVKKDGTQTSFLTSKIPLKDETGSATGLVGISLDITTLKQKESELRDLINVTSLQNKKLINFAHIISHNLRSHTANFSMLLDFLMNEQDEKEKINIIKMLTNTSDNLLETLDNLNEVVAISTNVNIEKEHININEKIELVKQNLKGLLINSNVKIISSIPDNKTVYAIPAYVDSILSNLITNSVKYSKPELSPVIKLSIKNESNFTVLSIEDNGIGIDLEKYGDKLFGMYKTFHGNTDARGIGLYITKNQIEAMNGKINVQSEVNKGTIFKIYFNDKN